MRVGIFVGAAAPDAGGGFTIVDELLKAAKSSATTARHEYVILTAGDTSAFEAAYQGMTVLSLGDVLRERKTSTRAARFVGRKAAKVLGLEPVDVSSDYVPRAAIDDLLRRNRIDVLWFPSAWECVSLEIPYFTVVWDLQHRLQPFFPEVSADGAWERRERRFSTLLRRAALVITGTEVGRREIQEFYGVPSANIRIMPHPTPTFDAQLPAPERGDYLFYPAQFWAHKNHVNLLEALRLLRDRGENLRLVLTGADKGNLGFVRETIARLRLEDAVELAGFAPRERIIALYRGAVALTYVTFFGPENLPPLEAFALSCPVVASDVPGAREQLGDAALLVDPRRPEQIADAVAAVRRDDGVRRRLVERGLARADRFRARDFVQAVESWLDDFAAVRRCWPSG